SPAPVARGRCAGDHTAAVPKILRSHGLSTSRGRQEGRLEDARDVPRGGRVGQDVGPLDLGGVEGGLGGAGGQEGGAREGDVAGGRIGGQAGGQLGAQLARAAGQEGDEGVDEARDVLAHEAGPVDGVDQGQEVLVQGLLLLGGGDEAGGE